MFLSFPSGTDISFGIISQHFVLGYFRWDPADDFFQSSTTCVILFATCSGRRHFVNL
jgi:hypothetical protein